MGLDTVELLMKIENHFAINIPDEEAEKIETVNDFYQTVAKHLGATGDDLPDIQNEINRVIANHAGFDLEKIKPHMTITGDLGLD